VTQVENAVLQDQLEIEQLLYRYALAVDSRSPDLLERCFAPGIRLSGPGFELSENVAAFIIAELKSRYLWTQHNVFNPLYEVEGDHARGVANCIASHVEGGAEGHSKLDWYLRYHDRLVRHDGQWRIRERRLEVAYIATQAVTPFPDSGA